MMLLESTLPDVTFAAAVSRICNRGSKFGEAFTLFRFERMYLTVHLSVPDDAHRHDLGVMRCTSWHEPCSQSC